MKPIPEIELLSKDRIKSYQEEKLKQALSYAFQYSPFYKRLLKGKFIDNRK